MKETKNYTRKQILKGLECWMDSENSNLYCEDCPFFGGGGDMAGKCKSAVYEEVKKILGGKDNG